MPIKALVTGDIHIGRHSSATPPEATEASTKSTWQAIVEYAINQSIDLLLLTGDIIDRDNKYYEAVGPLQAGFEKLSRAGVSVYMVAGNHDYDVLPQVVTAAKYPDVHLLGLNANWEEVIYTKKETGEKVRIIGWSFPAQYVNDTQFHRLTPPLSDTELPTIALVHGDIYVKDSRYNPLNLDVLKSHSYIDAWLLGHIHRPDILSEASPLVLYPGSPHSLSSKEEGRHGVCLLTVEGRRLTNQAIPFSPIRYATIQIDVTSLQDEESFRSHVVQELRRNATSLKADATLRFLIFDIRFVGMSNFLRRMESWAGKLMEYEETGSCHVSVRKVEFDIQPILDISHLKGENSYIGVLATAISHLETGERTPFVDNLLKDWKNRYRALASASLYAPLITKEEDIESMAKEYVLAECRKLIAELNNQLGA